MILHEFHFFEVEFSPLLHTAISNEHYIILLIANDSTAIMNLVLNFEVIVMSINLSPFIRTQKGSMLLNRFGCATGNIYDREHVSLDYCCKLIYLHVCVYYL